MSLQIGDKAPDFALQNQDGNTIRLSDLQGKKVVLYFYPKDNTPGCTAQACNLRDNYEALQAAGYQVLGISSDSQKSHKKFAEKQNLPFPLLVDEDLSVHHDYHTWVEKQMFGRKYMGTARTTFIIDEKGMIEDIIAKVNTKEHSSQILK
ncbi:MAG TPA: thioredoxin-dependent thiol peroxidase [Cyclobacteriaceae bacterium]|nr:thioredoxin-dependent thiol peroxidase [Cyclobacteriaceae bacterium]